MSMSLFLSAASVREEFLGLIQRQRRKDQEAADHRRSERTASFRSCASIRYQDNIPMVDPTRGDIDLQLRARHLGASRRIREPRVLRTRCTGSGPVPPMVVRLHTCHHTLHIGYAAVALTARR